jgi:hypothetical protein
LLADVTVAANCELLGLLVVAEVSAGGRDRLLEERPFDFDDRFVRAGRGDEEQPERTQEKARGAVLSNPPCVCADRLA